MKRAAFLVTTLLAAAALAFPPIAINIHLAGDSTMAEKAAERRPETGWGEMLEPHFRDNVRIVNHAKNGRSTRTFLSEGLWHEIVVRLTPADYVFIQFGHNDESPEKQDRYTSPADFRSNLSRMVVEVRAQHAQPVLLTPVMRRRFRDGEFYDVHGEYPDMVRNVADAQGVALLDLHRASQALLERFGEEGSKALFLHLKPGENPNYPDGLDDDTHFSPLGAGLVAELAVQEIRSAHPLLAISLRSRTLEGEEKDGLLSAARIDALPSAERYAWRAHMLLSQVNRARDLDAMNAELRAAGKEKWTAAPVGTGFAVTRAMTGDWFKGREARELGDVIVSYQTPAGGWSKRMEYKHKRAPGESFGSEDSWNWIGTLDNGATTEQLRFLGAVVNAGGNERQRASFERGIDYLLAAQYPTGCWPQVYPLEGGYHDAATFNDDATVHALQVLRSVARGEYGFVGTVQRQHAARAVQLGVHCIVALQVQVGGKKTVWGAQQDPISFQPVKARAYEHASLSGRESAAILDFLMQLDSPSAGVVRAVHDAAAWFRASAINGYSYVPRGVLTEKAGAGPLWARFYELGTNKPIFSDRDSVIKYSLSEIGEERRTGYLWYTDEPVATLRRYDAWARRHPPEQ